MKLLTALEHVTLTSVHAMVSSQLMLDSLEVMIPVGTALRRRYQFLRDPRSHPLPPDRFGASRSTRFDLRMLGLKVMFIAQSRHDRGYEKLAFINTSLLSFDQMRGILEAVVDAEPSDLRLARIDFAVDVSGLTVAWFQHRVTVPRKRWLSEFTECSGPHGRTIQSFTIGKRPNRFLIYNKASELRSRGKLAAQLNDSDMPLTRVERQCGGSGIPNCLRTFGQLPNAVGFDPFAALKFISPDPLHLEGVTSRGETATQLLAAIGLRAVINELGAQRATRFLNTRSKGNAMRIRRSLELSDLNAEQIPPLRELYQRFVNRQLQV